MPSNLKKVLQAKLYTLLATKWGMSVCVIGAFLSLNVLFLTIRAVVSPDVMQSVPVWKSNISGRDFRDKCCANSIDIVYTWVNGSDPEHSKALSIAKREKAGENAVPCNSTQDPEQDQCFRDEESPSRYKDNEELRFSLRSVEKYAPWVRHIFIVTNGQIPYWLDLSNPHITVVTHKEIFVNMSHLPSFSSPAIEAHLHRIPGLSRRFIYLNDDVMFGAPIWPDDFYTEAEGQKIFLSWPVPNCADGCPSNWIGDGYCDHACNNSACEYDGGDCANYTGPTYGGWWTPTYSYTDDKSSKYCSRGCPDNWIGDRYCDRMCTNAECGFDAGDCGVTDIFGSLTGYVATPQEMHNVPKEVLAVYFNLSGVVGNATIVDATHSNGVLIRAAVISKSNMILTLVFNRDVSRQNATVSLTLERNGVQLKSTFNVSGDTKLEANESSTAANGSAAAAAAAVSIGTPQDDAGLDLMPNSSRELTLDAIPESFDDWAHSDFPWDVPGVGDTRERDWMQELFGGEQEEEEAAASGLDDSPAFVGSVSEVGSLELSPTSQGSSEEEIVVPMSSRTGRKTMDMFGDSLKFVNNLYNKEFGAEGRKVPAHMPHFIDSEIMKELQARWPEQWDRTSSNNLRAPHDMQFSFSYMYYLMSVKEKYDMGHVWDEYLDLDKDGYLNVNEVRTLAAHLKGTPVEQSALGNLINDLYNCSLAFPGEEGHVSYDIFVSCNKTVQQVERHFRKNKAKWKHEVKDTDQIAFIMVSNNDSSLQGRLDGIRVKKQKFICLNDNLNHSCPSAQEAVDLLHEFYMALFPLPSFFELPPGVRNQYLNIDELRIRQSQARRRNVYVIAVAGLMLLSMFYIVKKCVSRGQLEGGRKWRERRARKFMDI